MNWALTVTAGLLTIGRFAIRGYNSRRLYWDDLTHLLAFVALVVHGALLLVHKKVNAAIGLAHKENASTSVLLGMYQSREQLSTANDCLLYSVFWLIKIGFLLFYYRLFSTSTTFRKAWWVVLAFTILTFWVPIGGVIHICGEPHTLAEYGESDR